MKVGSGTFGSCFLCEKEETGERVVLKKIAIGEDATKEAQLLNRLRHPNIVDVHEQYRSDRSLYIIMEYMKGGDLDVFLKQSRTPLRSRTILDYCQQITEALKFVHSMRVVHRDVKPVNILLNADYTTIKLTDFGISVELAEGKLLNERIGTSAFMSPEMLEGREYDFKCDMWALGCVLYELAERRRTFEGSSDLAIHQKVCTAKYTPPSRPKITPLIEMLLTVSTEVRPSAEEFLSRLAIHRRRTASFLHNPFSSSK